MDSSAPQSEHPSPSEDDTNTRSPLRSIPEILAPPRVIPLEIKRYVSSPQLSHSEWSTHDPASKDLSAPEALRLVTWNVDFMTPNAAERVACILDHLRDSVLADVSAGPSCILLQELNAESFERLLECDWVREHYAITPPDMQSWRTYYGVATLVSRDIRARNAQMVHFTKSIMGRTALFVDVEMSVPGSDSDETRIVRIANTHLESLPMGESSRPLQLQTVADKLREEDVTGGGVVGGDMNMIGPADQDIHVRAGLQDACDDSSAVTWGFQPMTQFDPGRLDRVFYVGDRLEVAPVEVIGQGVKVKGTDQWASDHYGLKTTITLRSHVQA